MSTSRNHDFESMINLNPASVDIASLPQLPLKHAQSLPPIPALYFCINGEEVLYIGITANLQVRWRSHHKTIELFNYPDPEIRWLAITTENVSTILERRFVEYWKPKLNQRLPSLGLEPDFIKIYNDADLNIFSSLPARSFDILLTMALMMEFDNSLLLNTRRKHEIANYVKIQPQTLDNYLCEIVAGGLLIRISRGEYFINLYYISKGEWNQIYQNRQAWDTLKTEALVLQLSPNQNHF